MKPDIPALALALGAVALWAAWALMPDAATNDAVHILTAVAAAREAVHASALLQLFGSALLAAGLAAEVADARRTRASAIATLLGVVGMAADAVYHQLAYEMTAPGVSRDGVLPVMIRMQKVELRPVVPLLLLFLIGTIALGVQRLRQSIGSRWTALLLMAPAVIVPLGVVGMVAFDVPRRVVALGTLGLTCAGLVGVAADRGRQGAAGEPGARP
jgi:hypothetical protein